MNGWIKDPNSDYYHWMTADPARDVNWTLTVASDPPDGFDPDLGNPGWYFNGGDPNDIVNCWWHDETVTEPTVDPYGAWSVDEIAGMAQCPKSNVGLYWPLVFARMTERGQGSIRSLAAAVGTIAVETASTFASVEEAYWLSPAQRLAYYNDTRQHAVYSGGQQYHGRCLIQLTHDYNYKNAGDAIGVDLVGDPDAALVPENAAAIFAWYWASRDIQSMADRQDWAAVRRAVQGGTAGLPRLIQVATGLLAIASQRGLV